MTKVRFLLIGMFVGRIIFLPVTLLMCLSLLAISGLIYLVREALPELWWGTVHHLTYPWVIWKNVARPQSRFNANVVEVANRQSWPGLVAEMIRSWFGEFGRHAP